MGGYMTNFLIYTMAMAGLISFAVFVYKKVMDGSFHKTNSKFLAIEETMSLTPRKTLHVVRAGNEKFLIASDIDRTTLISKLDKNSESDYQMQILQEGINISNIKPKNINTEQRQKKHQVHLEPIEEIRNFKQQMDSRDYYQNSSQIDDGRLRNSRQKQTTIKEMARKINEL